MPKLILCRHGQSVWNAENLFTGWADVIYLIKVKTRLLLLVKLKDQGIEIDIVYTSLLEEQLRLRFTC